MRVKELADYLEVTKPTVTKAMKELGLTPNRIGEAKGNSRYDLNYEEALKIAKKINPSKDVSSIFDQAEKAENGEPQKEENPQNEAEELKNKEEKTQKEGEKIANGANKSTNDLLDLLKEQLRVKDDLIKSQQETITRLTETNYQLSNTNTALTTRLAIIDKSNDEPQEIIIDQAIQEQEPIKKHWWQRIFK